jgi:hypothetical protein
MPGVGRGRGARDVRSEQLRAHEIDGERALGEVRREIAKLCVVIHEPGPVLHHLAPGRVHALAFLALQRAHCRVGRPSVARVRELDDRVFREPGEGQIEAARFELDHLRGQDFIIPSGCERGLIVRQDVCLLLRLRPSGAIDDRNVALGDLTPVRKLDHAPARIDALRGHAAAVAGAHDAVVQDRVGPAVFRDHFRDHLDLRIRVCARIAVVWPERFDATEFDAIAVDRRRICCLRIRSGRRLRWLGCGT